MKGYGNLTTKEKAMVNKYLMRSLIVRKYIFLTKTGALSHIRIKDWRFLPDQVAEGKDVPMKIKEIRRMEEALPLVWDVFCKYEAVNYPDSGKQAFWDAIHTTEYLQTLRAYGEYEGKTLIGIIASYSSAIASCRDESCLHE